MKALHNHIFSKSDCISKEEMLKYINKELSKKELHQIETHLLDCPFCSEALEGLEHAHNPSILFAIDAAIDKKTAGTKKSSNFINWMIAAGIVAIFVTTFFVVNNLKKLTTSKEMAVIQNEQKPIDEENENFTESTPVEEEKDIQPAELNNKIEEGESQKQLPSTTTVTSGFKEKDKKIAANNNDEMVEEEVLEIIEEEEVSEYAEEVVFEEENLSESNYKSTNAESLTEMDLAVTKNHNEFIKDNAGAANQKRSVKQKASRSKDKIATAPSAIASYEVVADEYNSALPSKYLYGLKVVDYTEVYTLEYIQQKELEDQSLSPRYGNSMEKKAEESSLNNMYQEITYKDLLDDAIKNYKEKKYTVAKEQFFQILQKHPDDVNAQFYLGLCYYELGEYVNAMQYFELTVKNKQQAFNQEAAWYGALCLKNTGQIKAAKKAFKQIVDLKGFYAQKAQKELMLIESQENKMNKNGQFMEDGK